MSSREGLSSLFLESSKVAGIRMAVELVLLITAESAADRPITAASTLLSVRPARR